MRNTAGQTFANEIIGQLFIAGNQPFQNATIIVKLVDTNLQDAPAVLIASQTLEHQARPQSGFVRFQLSDLPFYSLIHDQGKQLNLAHLSLQAEVLVDGKLAYITRVAHNINVTCRDEAYATVVAQPI